MPEIRDGGPIPEELLRAAQEINLALPYRHVQECIARALMAARKDERERAARIAREFAAKMQAASEKDDPSNIELYALRLAAWNEANTIASAILSDKEQSHAE